MISLIVLKLSYNDFTGPLPDTLLNPPGMKVLEVNVNMIDGPIPEVYCGPRAEFLDSLTLASTNLCPTCDYSIDPPGHSDWQYWDPKLHGNPFCNVDGLDRDHLFELSNAEEVCSSNCYEKARNNFVCADFECEYGYSASSTPVCNNDGVGVDSWSFSPCLIIPDYCTIPDVDNVRPVGRLPGETMPLFTIVEFEADFGYSFFVQDELGAKTCDATMPFVEGFCVAMSPTEGQFTGKMKPCPIPDYCLPNECTAFPRNATIDETVEIVCKPGCYIDEPPRRMRADGTCEPDSRENGVFSPTCVPDPDYCFATALANQRVNGGATASVGLGGTILTKCDTGYAFSPFRSSSRCNLTRTCTSGGPTGVDEGILAPENPGPCELIHDYCADVAPCNGFVNGGPIASTTLGGTITYACEPGFRFANGGAEVVRSCELDGIKRGKLSGTAPGDCEPIVCDVPAPTAGTVNNNLVNAIVEVGGDVVFQCQEPLVFPPPNQRRLTVTCQCALNATSGDASVDCRPPPCLGLLTSVQISQNGVVICGPQGFSLGATTSEVFATFGIPPDSVEALFRPLQARELPEPAAPNDPMYSFWRQNGSPAVRDAIPIDLIIADRTFSVTLIQPCNVVANKTFGTDATIADVREAFGIAINVDIFSFLKRSMGPLANSMFLYELVAELTKKEGLLTQGIDIQLFVDGGVCVAGVPANGVVDGCPRDQEVPVGATVTFACDNGYQFSDGQFEITATCEEGGESIDAGDCEPIEEYCTVVNCDGSPIFARVNELLVFQAPLGLFYPLSLEFPFPTNTFETQCLPGVPGVGGGFFQDPGPCLVDPFYCEVDAPPNSLVNRNLNANVAVNETVEQACEFGFADAPTVGTTDRVCGLVTFCEPDEPLSGALSDPLLNCAVIPDYCRATAADNSRVNGEQNAAAKVGGEFVFTCDDGYKFCGYDADVEELTQICRPFECAIGSTFADAPRCEKDEAVCGPVCMGFLIAFVILGCLGITVLLFMMWWAAKKQRRCMETQVQLAISTERKKCGALPGNTLKEMLATSEHLAIPEVVDAIATSQWFKLILKRLQSAEPQAVAAKHCKPRHRTRRRRGTRARSASPLRSCSRAGGPSTRYVDQAEIQLTELSASGGGACQTGGTPAPIAPATPGPARRVSSESDLRAFQDMYWRDATDDDTYDRRSIRERSRRQRRRRNAAHRRLSETSQTSGGGLDAF